MNKQKKLLRYGGVLIILLVFLLLTAALLGRDFWRISYHSTEKTLGPVTSAEFVELEDTEYEPGQKCLYIWQEDSQSLEAREMMDVVLAQMKVPYASVSDVQFQTDMLKDCGTVVLGVTILDSLGDKLLDIVDWVNGGGNLLLLYPPSWDSYLQFLTPVLGIKEQGSNMVEVSSFRFTAPLMPGGEGNVYTITDPYETSLALQLNSDCDVYMESTDEYPIPLLWKRKAGQGNVVVSNLGYVGKSYRGFYAAAFSLLDECFAYPVINGAAFFLDDFPAPVPGGTSEFIQKDYDLSIEKFISDVWWKDMSDIAEKHNFPYTGMVIEQYSDETDGTVERNNDIVRYQHFGNAILEKGGELGYHGYNHMPLVLENFDFKGDYESYNKWKSVDAMKDSLDELTAFCGNVFPREDFQVYMPPSNVLSDEGRRLLAEQFPQIKSITSTYLPGEAVYAQEFEVADDGIVETPQTVSGFVFDDFTNITALSELTFHYVSTHFAHLDDMLEEGRGAELGWPELSRRFSAYTDWLFETAPDIRGLTGSELAGAVQRYDKLNVYRFMKEDSVTLKLSGFLDEVWLLVRFNGRDPGEVTGGTLTKVIDGLYLLQAEEPEVKIMFEK